MQNSTKFKPTLILLRGTPGSGKSTAAARLVKPGRAIAADDYFTEERPYSRALQGKAHEWCFNRCKELLGDGSGDDVAVTSIFNPAHYLDHYVELGLALGCAVQIIHCESLQDEKNPLVFPSEHNVPDSVIQYHLNHWEPYHKPVQLGISLDAIAENLIGIRNSKPDLVICDMDGTLKWTQSGKPFPQSPYDFELNPVLVTLLAKLQGYKDKVIPFYIASNQRGIEINKKSEAFLLAEVKALQSKLLLAGVRIKQAIFAPARGKNDSYIFTGFQLKPCRLKAAADKPSGAMLLHCLQDFEISGTQASIIWYVGNAHTQAHSDDYQAFLDFKSLVAKRKGEWKVYYLPVEFAGLI